MEYPGIPRLKLKCNLKQTTRLDPKAVIGLLLSTLKQKEYKILEETDDSLTFYNNPWMPRWNFQPYIALDGGSVEIEISNNSRLVSLDYYLDFFPSLLLFSITIIYTIIDRQYDVALFFVCFGFIACVIAIIRARLAAKQILKEILNNESVS